MPQPFPTTYHPPIIAAGGITVISLFVLLVCNLAVEGLTSKLAPQTRTCIPSSFATDTPYLGSDELVVGSKFYGNKQNHCAAFGLSAICCPPDTACRSSSPTSFHVFYCTSDSYCSDKMGESSKHTIERPASARGGCCAIGPRGASDPCFEYPYRSLAVLQPLPVPNSTSFISQGLYHCIIPAIIGPMQTGTPPSSLSTVRAAPTSASQKRQPENVSQKGEDLPIGDSILETATIGGVKIGEIAVQSQAEENWESKNRKRLRRLGCVVMGLLVITVVMFVF